MHVKVTKVNKDFFLFLKNVEPTRPMRSTNVLSEDVANRGRAGTGRFLSAIASVEFVDRNSDHFFRQLYRKNLAKLDVKSFYAI
jgi:hypothetical protein